MKAKQTLSSMFSVRRSMLDVLLTLLLAMGMAAAVPCLAQVYVPAAITLDLGAPSNGVKITWQTVPGKNYDVLTAEHLGQVWMATNGSPIKAPSTLTNFADTANRSMLFYRVREEATPPGNTATITTTTISRDTTPTCCALSR